MDLYESGSFNMWSKVPFLGISYIFCIGFPIVIRLSTQNARLLHFQNEISPSPVNEFSKFWYLERAETLLFQKRFRFAWF